MARNGSGTYILPAGNPVVTGNTISSTWANTTLSDIASALTGSIAADGQTTPTANLKMATFAHTGVGNATVRTMYASAGQVQDSTLTYLTTVAGTDVITAIAPTTMSAYATGQSFHFIASGSNTSAVTVNINSIGAKSVKKTDGNALSAGDIVIGSAVQIIYDGTNFQCINPASALNGNVVGPASATDNAIARFDTTTGKLIQNSVVTIGDTGNMAGVGTLGCGAVTSSSTIAGTNITTGGNVTGSSASCTGNAATATLANKIENTGGWNITPSGTKLYFNYNGTNVASLDSSGVFTTLSDIVSNGTV